MAWTQVYDPVGGAVVSALLAGIPLISLFYMATHIMPLFKVDFTSKELHSQIYINSVNWALYVAVVLAICGFGESHKLAAAYGLAVTGTMSLRLIAPSIMRNRITTP